MSPHTGGSWGAGREPRSPGRNLPGTHACDLGVGALTLNPGLQGCGEGTYRGPRRPAGLHPGMLWGGGAKAPGSLLCGPRLRVSCLETSMAPWGAKSSWAGWGGVGETRRGGGRMRLILLVGAGSHAQHCQLNPQ